jgi:hypothetical protein
MKYPKRIGKNRLPKLAIKFKIPKPVAANAAPETTKERKKIGPNVEELI